MGQPSNKKIDPDFIERTLKLIEDYDIYCKVENITEQKDLKFSLLINCLLWLIIFVYEQKEPRFKEVLKEKINEITEFNEIYEKNSRLKQGITLKEFLRHFRNGIAHTHIEAIIDEDWNANWKEIEFRDECGRWSITFERTKLSYINIRNISEYIAKKYIETKK